MWAHLTVRHGADSTAVLRDAQAIAQSVGCEHTCFQVCMLPLEPSLPPTKP